MTGKRQVWALQLQVSPAPHRPALPCLRACHLLHVGCPTGAGALAAPCTPAPGRPPPLRHTRAAAAVVRLSRRRCGAARREALGASRLASAARVRPPQPVPVRMFVPNLPVSEPSSGLLTNPDLSPTPTCALNPDSPCPYPLRTGRPYTRTSCVRPLYAGRPRGFALCRPCFLARRDT